MAGFHVYVDGPVERTPEAMRRLAAAMAQRYGLATEELIARLTRGRFRVKANVDRKTAEVYAKDLADIGARVTIDDASRASVTTPPVGVQRSAPITARQVPALPPTAGAVVDSGGDAFARPTAAREARSGATTGQSSAMTGPSAASGGVGGRASRGASQPMPIIERRRATSTGSRPVVATGSGDAGRNASGRGSAGSVHSVDGTRAAGGGEAGRDAVAGARTSGSASSHSGGRAAPAIQAGLPSAASGGRTSSSSLPPATYGRSTGSSLPISASGGMPLGGALPNQTGGTQRGADVAGSSAVSGLAAAFTDVPVSGDFGALDTSGGPLMLSTVGGEEVAPLRGGFEPPVAPQRTTPPKDVPVDLFAPPEMAEQQAVFELAVDERKVPVPAQAPVQTQAPAQVAPQALVASKVLVAPGSQPVAAVAVAAPMTVLGAVREAPRGRLVAGVVVAIVVGFVPVHLVARSREVAAFEAVDRGVEARQAAVDSPEAYAALDGFRGAQLEKKTDAKRSIAITSLLLWAVIAGLLGYVWFRRVPWERWARG